MSAAMKAAIKTKLRSIAALSVLPMVFMGTAAYMHHNAPASVGNLGTALLLLPDSRPASDPAVRVWLDAAAEEGVHLGIVHDSEFLNPMRGSHLSEAVIVPDQIHRVCNDALVGALYSFVAAGGKLMVVYDACTYDLNGNFTKGQSRLSDLVGIAYALYDQYKTDCIAWGSIWGKAKAMADLEIPPGKYIPAEPSAQGGFHAVSLANTADAAKARPDTFIFRRYQYGDVDYPAFRTEGKFAGTELLGSPAGVVAGVHQHGAGTALFANLPLAYLETRTDGLLLHSFVHYFAINLARAPYLAAVPDGVGGLIFNWHIDGGSAIRYLDKLWAAGIFNNGPFSIHFTAGPDVDAPHDGKGLDLDHNPRAQQLVRDFESHGDAIGSHGGWIHNYFGTSLDDNNESTFAPYIQWNVNSLEHASGERMLEYSAPVGNHPEWVTRWLERNGFIAYYFTGDSGMAPTHVYRDEHRDADSIWAFPILHMGKYAALEEMGFDDLPDSEVRNWLFQITDFTANSRSARLVYTHPLAAVRYLQPLEAFLQHARELNQQGNFRWYTMTSLAEFLNTREKVEWNMAAPVAEGGNATLIASIPSPKSLEHFTWILPRGLYREPKVERGSATIRNDGENWLIIAGNCRRLEVRFRNPATAIQLAKDGDQ
ncbi:MAG TPA: hypothetical protein VE998_06570 [Terriglobales bacterium]|nr:hypothetical protein [Terriglobales bacterium]